MTQTYVLESHRRVGPMANTGAPGAPGAPGVPGVNPGAGVGVVGSESIGRLVARRLIGAIITGRFEPDQRLVISRLAQQMGVSATPVREALAEVEALGLIELLPNRGPIVPVFGAEQLRDLYLVRAVLEAEATTLACGKIALKELRHNATLLRTMRRSGQIDESSLWALDMKLHEMICECCPSRRLTREIKRHQSIVVAIHDEVGFRPSPPGRVLAEHLRIVNALISGDAVRAAAAMRFHIEQSVNDMCAALFPNE